LWQVSHRPAVVASCWYPAPAKLVVVWQVPHSAVVAMWPAGLPTARWPLWQVLHKPPVIAAVWMNLARLQSVVSWHAPHPPADAAVR
jgi:hypothetical protein